MQKRFFRLPHIIAYLCAFVLGLKQLREPDVWWQLLTGRWMLENGAVTKTDMFSYTAEGASWVNVKWLYEVVIAALEKVAGPHGVLLLQGLFNVGMVYLLFHILAIMSDRFKITISTFASVLAALLFLALSEYRMAGRPEMVSHLLSVVYLFILWRGKELSWKQIAPLALLQCLWANMHEGYPVGMVIIGVFTGSAFLSYIINKEKVYLQQAIRLSAVFAAAAVAILLNPNGIQLWLQPFEIFRQLGANKYTTELYSFKHIQYWTLQAEIHIALLSLVSIFWIARIIINKKEKTLNYTPQLIGYLILIPLTGYLSLSANRNIPFAQIVLMPSYAIMLHWIAEKLKLEQKGIYTKLSKRAAIISIVVAGLFYVSVVSDSFYKFTRSPNRYGAHVSMLHNPLGASEFIKRHNIEGPAFSDYFISSYLLWDQYPDFRSFIDLRDLDIFSSEFFDKYFEVYTTPNKFYDLDSQYHFNYIVLSTSQLTGLQQVLYWGRGYNLIYVDPVSVIYLKDTKENERINKDLSIQKLFSWPEAYPDPGWAILVTKLLDPLSDMEDGERNINAPIHAAMFYNTMKNYRAAKKLLLPAMSYNDELSEDPRALTALGSTYIEIANSAKNEQEQKSALDSARYLFDKAISIDEGTAGAYSGLANMYLMLGNPEMAAEQMATYIKLKPLDGFGMYLYGMCYHYILGRNSNKKNANMLISIMKKATQIDKSNTRPYLYIAEGYYAKGDNTNARKYVQKVIDNDTYLAKDEEQLLNTLKIATGVQ